MRNILSAAIFFCSSAVSHAAVVTYTSGLLWQNYSVGPRDALQYEFVGPLQTSTFTVQFEVNLQKSATINIFDFSFHADPFEVEVSDGTNGGVKIVTDALGDIVDWNISLLVGTGGDVLLVDGYPDGDWLSYTYEYAFFDSNGDLCDSCVSDETISARTLGDVGSWSVVPLPSGAWLLLSGLGLTFLVSRSRREKRAS